MSTRVVHVDIHGQQYAIRSELDPQYIGELAALPRREDAPRRARARQHRPAARRRHRRPQHRRRALPRPRRHAGVEGRLRARAAEIERISTRCSRTAQASTARNHRQATSADDRGIADRHRPSPIRSIDQSTLPIADRHCRCRCRSSIAVDDRWPIADVFAIADYPIADCRCEYRCRSLLCS